MEAGWDCVRTRYSTSAFGDTHIRNRSVRGILLVAGSATSESTFDAATVKVKAVYAVWAH